MYKYPQQAHPENNVISRHVYIGVNLTSDTTVLYVISVYVST